MQIALTDNETRALLQTLDQRLRELRHEIVHTSNHDYRNSLKEHERVLQCLHDKVLTYYAISAA